MRIFWKILIGIVIFGGIFGVFSYWYYMSSETEVFEADGECVIVLHGLGRTARAMSELSGEIANRGFKVVNLEYPSMAFGIEELSNRYLKKAVDVFCKDRKVNFVTHSLGGIIVRKYLSDNKLENMGRVVMIAPPNQGSSLAAYASEFPLINWIAGPVVKELGRTGKKDFFADLKKVDYELGIIAGNKSSSYLQSFIIPGEDDDKVSVYETRLEGAKEHIIVPVSHFGIMKNYQVMSQVISFLKKGEFKK